MILIVGATGNLGSEICQQLARKGKDIRALVRSTSAPAKVEKLQQLGAELIQADLKDPSSLEAACQGIKTIISTATVIVSRQPGDTMETVDLKGQENLIEAARLAGVSHFIFVSISPNIKADFPLSAAKRGVENRLKESGLNYTILQPTNFMEIWLGPFLGFDIVNAKAQIFGEGHSKISFISMPDVAKFAVEAVDNPAARNATIPLGGPEPLSPLEVINRIENLIGHKFEVQFIPEEALKAQQAGAQDEVSQSVSALMVTYANGDPIEMAATLKNFPIKLTPVTDYARRVITS
jgi:uncharacterized protein YbjT (DUF2867 family)